MSEKVKSSENLPQIENQVQKTNNPNMYFSDQNKQMRNISSTISETAAQNQQQTGLKDDSKIKVYDKQRAQTMGQQERAQYLLNQEKITSQYNSIFGVSTIKSQLDEKSKLSHKGLVYNLFKIDMQSMLDSKNFAGKPQFKEKHLKSSKSKFSNCKPTLLMISKYAKIPKVISKYFEQEKNNADKLLLQKQINDFLKKKDDLIQVIQKKQSEVKKYVSLDDTNSVQVNEQQQIENEKLKSLGIKVEDYQKIMSKLEKIKSLNLASDIKQKSELTYKNLESLKKSILESKNEQEQRKFAEFLQNQIKEIVSKEENKKSGVDLQLYSKLRIKLLKKQEDLEKQIQKIKQELKNLDETKADIEQDLNNEVDAKQKIEKFGKIITQLNKDYKD